MAEKKASPAAKKTKAGEEVVRVLTGAEQRFVDEYIIDLNGTKAYLRAFPDVTEGSASTMSSRMLGKVEVQAAIANAQSARSDRTKISADRALEEVWNIATADPRELVEYRVGCCRYCWGENHLYQRTQGEFDRAMEEHQKAESDKEDADANYRPRPFNELGGVGYSKAAQPNPECPECCGEGIGRTVFHDTRNISAGAASLFAGIKETKDGLEVKFHSKEAMLDKLFRHLALYRDRVELTGKDGGPIQQAHAMSDEALLAIAAKAAAK